jgi:hypothetical protein
LTLLYAARNLSSPLAQGNKNEAVYKLKPKRCLSCLRFYNLNPGCISPVHPQENLSRLIPQTLALVLVSSFVLFQPTIVAAEPSSTGKAEKPVVASAQKTLKKKPAANHHRHLGSKEDCNACHTNCLIAGLACIAISIATACPTCGVICVAAQAGCEAVCNTTTACQTLNN